MLIKIQGMNRHRFNNPATDKKEKNCVFQKTKMWNLKTLLQ